MLEEMKMEEWRQRREGNEKMNKKVTNPQFSPCSFPKSITSSRPRHRPPESLVRMSLQRGLGIPR